MIRGIDYLSVHQAKMEYPELFSTFQNVLVLTDDDAATAVSIAAHKEPDVETGIYSDNNTGRET